MPVFECRKCLVIKDIKNFVKDKSRRRGHHPYCRICQNKIKNNKRALERSLDWQKRNKSKRKEIRKRWYDKNPELIRIYKSQRRLRENNQSDGTINKKSLRSLPSEICSICKQKLDWKKPNSVHLDHIIPLVKGGRHSIDNVQWTCRTCNLTKGGR